MMARKPGLRCCTRMWCLLFISLFSHCYAAEDAVSKQKRPSEESSPFSLIIRVYQKGNYLTHSYELNANRVKAVRYSTNAEQPQVLVDHELTPKQAERFSVLMEGVSLDSLEDTYIDSAVEGEEHLEYELQKGSQKKQTIVYFYEHQQLKALYNAVQELIPPEEAHWYY